MMDQFTNHRVQELYDFLSGYFPEGFSNELGNYEEYMVKQFDTCIRYFEEKDWNYLEETIPHWYGDFVHRLAMIIVYSQSKKLSVKQMERVYCLAFIHADYDDAEELLQDFSIFSAIEDTSLLHQVLERMQVFLEGYAYHEMNQPKEITVQRIKFVERRLKEIEQQ